MKNGELELEKREKKEWQVQTFFKGKKRERQVFQLFDGKENLLNEIEIVSP